MQYSFSFAQPFCNQASIQIFLILLPKVVDDSSVNKFRPTVIGNFSFKIITKTLVNKLAHTTGRMVSTNQFGFIHGRQIQGCIAIASDWVNLMQKRCVGGNIALKIEIKKAFATMRWPFCRKCWNPFWI